MTLLCGTDICCMEQNCVVCNRSVLCGTGLCSLKKDYAVWSRCMFSRIWACWVYFYFGLIFDTRVMVRPVVAFVREKELVILVRCDSRIWVVSRLSVRKISGFLLGRDWPTFTSDIAATHSHVRGSLYEIISYASRLNHNAATTHTDNVTCFYLLMKVKAEDRFIITWTSVRLFQQCHVIPAQNVTRVV
jgi:hypothetical protein